MQKNKMFGHDGHKEKGYLKKSLLLDTETANAFMEILGLTKSEICLLKKQEAIQFFKSRKS